MRWGVALVLLAALATAGYAWWGGLGQAPPGQPALVRLNEATFHVFTDQFNAATTRARVLVMLSPT